MQAVRVPRTMVILALIVGALLLVVLAPPAAHAAWTGESARIVDPSGTGYVSLLNVSIANQATNDSSAVTEVQLSEDQQDWYPIDYTGMAQNWVLSGESGAKTLYVRFAAADGTLSPVVATRINVDTQGPCTRALHAVRGAHGAVRFRYSVSDPFSPKVKATLVIHGAGVSKKVSLGWVSTGVHSVVAKLRLRAGRYRWSVQAVNLAFWAQQSQSTQTLIVR